MGKAILGLTAVLLAALLVVTDAEARRLGASRSVGVQRNVTAAKPATPPARPAQQAAPAQQPAGAAGAGSKWAPILGGLAIGGLLGALFGGSGLGAVLLIAALVLAAFVLVRVLTRPRAPAGQPLQYAGNPLQAPYAAIGSETVSAPPPSQAAGFEGAGGAARPAHVPADFDVAGFLRAAKLNFIRLQVANDVGNLDEIREFTTPEMFAELGRDVRERGGAAQHTDVVSLNADLLEVVSEADAHWASVRFSGMVRETPGTAPTGFEEVWNLRKPLDGSTGWLLAGIQQMH
jgi:predicted lipid-binding transport protein (Tim44 family)